MKRACAPEAHRWGWLGRSPDSVERWRRVDALRRAFVVSAVVASCAVADEARAQQMSNEMRSDYLFRRGEKEFDSGKYTEACADFAESLRLGPKLGTLLNLALCHETIGKTATAWNEFHFAAVWATQNNQKERREFAAQHAAALEGKLPRVMLQMPAGAAIATVEVDGEPIPDSRWYLPLFLDPGEHAVAVTAPGKERTTIKFRVTTAANEQIVTIPSLPDEAAKPAPTAATPPVFTDPDRNKRTIGYVSLGVSAAAIAIGSAFGLAAISARNDASANCAGNRCNEIGAPRYEDAQTYAGVSTTVFAVGLIAGVAGAWLVLSSKRPPAAALVPAPFAGARF